jgi:hypothetical protein
VIEREPGNLLAAHYQPEAALPLHQNPTRVYERLVNRLTVK